MMSAAKRRTFNSRIFRRVQAHAGVAVLFRASAKVQTPAEWQPLMPKQPTRLAVVSTAQADPALPFARLIGAVSAEQAAPVLAPPAGAPRADAGVLRPPKPSPIAPVVPQAAPPAIPAQEKGERRLEQDWPRLQNILKRHKEAEAAGGKPEAKAAEPTEEVKTEAPESPKAEESVIHRALGTPAPPKPAAAPKRAARTQRIMPVPKPAAIQRAEAAEKPAEEKEIHPLQLAPEPEPAKPARPAAPPPRKPPEVKPTPAPAPRAAIQARREDQKPAVEAEPKPMPPAPAIQLTEREEKLVPKQTPEPTKLEQKAEAAPVPSPEEAGGSAFEQPMPLQAIWPVVQREPAKAVIPPAEETIQAPAEIAPTEKKRLKKVESFLEKVEVETPSDSRVEVITPRRPRPGVTAKPLQLTPEPLETPSEEELPAEIKAPEQPAPKPKAKPEMIQTEIGPLPGDLWQLIGQPAPQTEPKAAAPAQPAEPVGLKPSEPVRQAGYLWPVEEPEEAEEPQPVQMEAESATPAPETASAAPAAGGEVNIDELARQVYREIRKRLSIEWDRFRRRK